MNLKARIARAQRRSKERVKQSRVIVSVGGKGVKSKPCVGCNGRGKIAQASYVSKGGKHYNSKSVECQACNGFGWQWTDGEAPTICVEPSKSGAGPMACGREKLCKYCPRRMNVERLDRYDVSD